jgi:CheY-like chemotaxis protein/ligand-binding sensor domain-containing protein/AraC-like DNA-binding protein/two-component sensor histidine kinase
LVVKNTNTSNRKKESKKISSKSNDYSLDLVFFYKSLICCNFVLMSKLIKFKILLISIGLIIFAESYAQQIKHLNTNDGLINGTINTFEKDSLGYVWIGTNQGLNRYSGVEFKNYNLGKLRGNGIAKIINLNGDLYMISTDGLLFKYLYDIDRLKVVLSLKDKRFLSLTRLNKSQLLIGLSSGFIIFDTKTNQATKILQSKGVLNRTICYLNGSVYSATSKGVYVFSYQAKNKNLILKEKILEGIDIIDIAFDYKNRLWVGTEVRGLFIVDKKEIKNIAISQISNKTYAIRKIAFDKNKNALLAIDRLGLFVLNEKFDIVKSYSHDADKDNSISQNSIYEIYVDNTNAYWLGVREGGINIIYEKDNVFTNISHIQNNANSIENNNIRSIFESSNGNLWFGTENGVSKYSSNQTWTNFNKSPKLYNTAILAINEYKGNLLLGTYGEGLLNLDKATGKVSDIKLEPKLPLKFIFNVSCFDDNLWIGGSDGNGLLAHYKGDKLVNHFAVGLVRTMVKGYDEINYVGSSLGFFEINTRNRSVRKIKEEIFNSFNEINNLNFDQLNNCIWIGNLNGLFKFNLSTEKVENIGQQASEDIGTVFSIKKDNMQNLYLACISGLWRYDIKKQNFRKYGVQDGLLINEFGSGASSVFKDGRLAFGGSKGAVIFNPIDLIDDALISDIFIANFQINGKVPDSITLSKNINYTRKLYLNYDQNTLSFNYETIKFHGSNKNTFIWKLEGYDESFQSISGNEKIMYSNLNPGTYNLRVQGFNADGIKGVNDYSLEIIVKNPFWKSWKAFAIYTLILCIIIFLIFRIVKDKIQKKFDDNRIAFFVEVAHDIRTPVSLIQLLVKQLSNQENVEKSIELIQRNTQNLNEYVTQLLDFQKIDRKQLKLSVSKVDLKDCLSKIINDFTPILQEKSLDIILDVKHIPVWFDVAKMNRIFYNLISNAIKYSNEGGEIKIQAFIGNDKLRIDFIDNGIGVPEEQQELIFKRFTRGTNVSNKGIPGTGLGLMLSKKIVELHGGKILLESKENFGSKFTVVLPNGTEHYSNEELLDETLTFEKQKKADDFINKNKLILLVEDNEELRKAVKNELVKHYSIIESANGKEGLLIALSKSPDLIITDVMMPEMDGKELCKLLKTNFKTSHIPIIMLSALADIDDKIQGLETGADAYVEKPFNVEILKITINNLIKSRSSVARVLDAKEVKKELTPDEFFLSDVIDIIKKNLKENDFSIDDLCNIMGLSRSNLYRKLKGLIQISPSDLIIKIKLSHAEELMKTKKISRISDIAYESGFNDPKYFSTLFKKHYGKTPKEFIEDN